MGSEVRAVRAARRLRDRGVQSSASDAIDRKRAAEEDHDCATSSGFRAQGLAETQVIHSAVQRRIQLFSPFVMK